MTADHLCDQIHAKDGVNLMMGSALLGEGEGKFNAVARALMTAGFDGCAICESEYAQVDDIVAAATHDIAAVRAAFAG